MSDLDRLGTLAGPTEIRYPETVEISRDDLRSLIAVARAAERAAILTYNPAHTDAQNDEYQRRAKALNDALSLLTRDSDA